MWIKGSLTRWRRYFSFSKKEMLTLLITSLTFGFVLSFRDWGETAFNARLGIFNLINATLIVLFSLIVHESAHKLFAIYRGYVTELKDFRLGNLITLFVAFLTNGFIPLLTYGGVTVKHLKLERLGRFRYYTNFWEQALISSMGPLANIMLAVLFKLLLPLNPPLMAKAMVINILLCLMNMLPIPPFDGGDVFYISRLLYAFLVAFFITLAVLLYTTSLTGYAVFIAIVMGALGWFFFGAKVDKVF